MSSSTESETFSFFNNLPNELQDVVWQDAVAGVPPQNIEFTGMTSSPTARSILTLLSTCSQSRSWALQRWRVTLGFTEKDNSLLTLRKLGPPGEFDSSQLAKMTRQTYFDEKTDTLVLDVADLHEINNWDCQLRDSLNLVDAFGRVKNIIFFDRDEYEGNMLKQSPQIFPALESVSIERLWPNLDGKLLEVRTILHYKRRYLMDISLPIAKFKELLGPLFDRLIKQEEKSEPTLELKHVMLIRESS